MAVIAQTVFIISAISGILALALTLANQYIANYGECKIVINGEKELVVDGGGTLLSILNEQELYLPSACGGKGTCGLCTCKILDGGGPILPTETPFFTKEELADNMRLSCQVKVKQDMQLSIPKDLLNAKKYEAKVEFIKDETKTIKLLRFKITDGQQIEFKAGQYVQLLAPPYPGNPESVYRAYSVASSALVKDSIELIIGYVEEGLVTTYVHQHLSKGDEVSFNGPFGDFYLRDTKAEIIMVAIGTGIAPIRSILYQLKDQQIQRKATFFFGARTQKDLVCAEEMYAFEKTIPHFKFRPVLSREPEGSGWEGDRGRVTDSIRKYIEEGVDQAAYMCGSPVMIESAVVELKKKKMPEEKIYFDEFG